MPSRKLPDRLGSASEAYKENDQRRLELGQLPVAAPPPIAAK